jgi:Pyridoxamine 5'-phosphate oxidase
MSRFPGGTGVLKPLTQSPDERPVVPVRGPARHITNYLAASSTNTKQPHDYHSPPVTEFSNPTREAIPWSRAVSQLDKLEPSGGSRGPTCWLSTTRRDGRPHVAGVVGLWLDDTLYFVSGPGTRKSRSLAADPRCSFAISLPDLDLVLDGAAFRVTDTATLTRVAEFYARPDMWRAKISVLLENR